MEIPTAAFRMAFIARKVGLATIKFNGDSVDFGMIMRATSFRVKYTAFHNVTLNKQNGFLPHVWLIGKRVSLKLKRIGLMLYEFPTIHTNIWDAVWAIPVILIVIILFHIFLKLPETWFSTVATVTGLILSVFISHPGNLSAGIFMGFFYGVAATGTIYSMKLRFKAHRKK